MAIDERRVGAKAYCWWYTTKMVWLILVPQLMAAVVSAQDPAEVRTVTYFDRFGDVVNFAYYDGEVEVECRMGRGLCGAGNEFRLVHKTSRDTVGTSKTCTGSEYTATIRVAVRKLKLGTYYCVDKGNETSSIPADQMQFVYRGCNESEGARKCTKDGTFCIVGEDSVSCSEKFNDINLCDNHMHALVPRYACPAREELCKAIKEGNYEKAKVEEGSTQCKSADVHIAYVRSRKLGESVQLESDKRQMEVNCQRYVAGDANLTCKFKHPNGTIAGKDHIKEECGAGDFVDFPKELFAGWGVNKVECNLVKPDKSSFRLYVYLVSMFGGVRIENIKHTDNSAYTKQLNCVLDPQLLPAGFHNRCKFKREGTNAMDDQKNSSATKYIEEKDSGRYRCECAVTYATYTPFNKFKPVIVNSNWTMAKGKPGYKHTTTPPGPYGTGTGSSTVATTTATGFPMKYVWIGIGGAAALLVMVTIVIIVIILCRSVDKIERVLWEADALHGKHAKASKPVAKQSNGQEPKKPNLPLQTTQVITEMDRMYLLLDTTYTNVRNNRAAAEGFWQGTLDKIMKHPGEKCHLMEALRWSRGRDDNTKYKFRDQRVKDRRCLDMFEIPLMDNDRILLGRNANDDKNHSKDFFHLLLAFYESKTGVVVQFGEAVTPGRETVCDDFWPYWSLKEGGQAKWQDPDNPQRKITVKTISVETLTKTMAEAYDDCEVQMEFSDESGSRPPRKLNIVQMHSWRTHEIPRTRDKTSAAIMETIVNHWRQQAGKGLRVIAFVGPRTYLAQATCAILFLHHRLWEKHAATNLNGLLRYLARRGVNPWPVFGPDKKRWSDYAGLYATIQYRFLWRCARLMIEVPQSTGEFESTEGHTLELWDIERFLPMASNSALRKQIAETEDDSQRRLKENKAKMSMKQLGRGAGQHCQLKKATVRGEGTTKGTTKKPGGTHKRPVIGDR